MSGLRYRAGLRGIVIPLDRPTLVPRVDWRFRERPSVCFVARFETAIGGKVIGRVRYALVTPGIVATDAGSRGLCLRAKKRFTPA
jgi:hypothetical protein